MARLIPQGENSTPLLTLVSQTPLISFEAGVMGGLAAEEGMGGDRTQKITSASAIPKQSKELNHAGVFLFIAIQL